LPQTDVGINKTDFLDIKKLTPKTITGILIIMRGPGPALANKSNTAIVFHHTKTIIGLT
jgi:hypothetical protein